MPHRRPIGSTAGSAGLRTQSHRDRRDRGRQGGHLATRRWFYLIPRSASRAAVNAIESHALAHPPGSKALHAGRAAGSAAPATADGDAARDGHHNAIPYISRVDAGTTRAGAALAAQTWEWCVRRSGARFQPSERAEVQPYRTAADKPIAKDRASEEIAVAPATAHDQPSTIIQRMTAWFREEGLEPLCRRTSRPRPTPATRTRPTASQSRRLAATTGARPLGEASIGSADAVRRYHLMGFTGRCPADKHSPGIDAVRAARDAAAALAARRVRARAALGRSCGRRSCTTRATAPDSAPHRPQFGREVHGGVNMDDYETPTTPSPPGTGFTIEPASTSPISASVRKST